jgi:hypothetical protein
MHYKSTRFTIRDYGIGTIVLFGAIVLVAQTREPHYHSTCCHPVSPENMLKLPSQIRERLKVEGCMVAQNSFTVDDPQPNNAIRGPWAAKGQQDWAVLCIEPDQLSVRLFWGGKAKCSDTILLTKFRANDGHWDDPDTVLWPADAQKIRSYDQAFGDRNLPRLDHAGLEVGGEEATTIYYCSEGKWVHLIGND